MLKADLWDQKILFTDEGGKVEVRMLEAGGGGLVEETIVNNKVVGMDEQVEDGKRQQVRGR